MLLALAWPSHQFHARARARMAEGIESWATCAVTELAFVRLFTTSAVVGIRRPVVDAFEVLAEMTRSPAHAYWPEMPGLEPLRRQGAFDRVVGHRQVNDAYLLELARRHGARLLTFDRRLEALGAEGVAEVLAP